MVLLAYAIRACRGIDSLAVTHLDTLNTFSSYRICERYAELDRLELPNDLAEQQQLAALLTRVRPRYTRLDAGVGVADFCGFLGEHTGVRVAHASSGMTASDVVER